MLRHKHIDRICCVILVLTLMTAGLFAGAAATGRIGANTAIGYEARLFDTSRVHTIDIVMDDWDAFLDTCTSETYASCHLVIDGESYRNVAIRGKGNTSLTSVENYGNDRYSFKVEFDHYQSGTTYHGLDKLSLNNLIQDNTCMKDYLAYTLMRRGGVAAPLCSFVQISVNGELWGLYLAVEGVEDAFLQRNYGKDYGELYKPDSLSFGGGRGNGGDFSMTDFMGDFSRADAAGEDAGFAMPDAGAPPAMGSPPGMSGAGTPPDASGMPADSGDAARPREDNRMSGSNGSDDVKLQYIDDDPASYANIFDSAKTDVTEADQARLIAALKALGEGDTSAVDTDAVIRYMAVHHFLCNDDSYTGMMVHNYYLYEEDGVLSMLPWDYNLAFGGFSGGSATSAVNTDIDEIVSGGSTGDRPMADWITASETYAAQYRETYAALIADTFDSGWFTGEIDRVTAMIAPYVASDPTAFCTYEEFRAAAETLRAFCLKRAESVSRQLSGDDTPVDASELDLSAMGGMDGGRGGMNGNAMGTGRDRGGVGFHEGEGFMQRPGSTGDTAADSPADDAAVQDRGAAKLPAGMQESGSDRPSAGAGDWRWLLGCAMLLCAAAMVVRRYPSHG